MSPGPDPPTSRSSPSAAVELVVSGAAEDEIVAAAAGDLVVDALLADEEVVRDRSGEVDAAGITVARIQPADQVVVRTEQVAREGGVVEVDALDAGLGVGAGEVAVHRDRLAVGVDDQIAVVGAGVVVEGVEPGQHADPRDKRRTDRDAISRAAAGRVDGFVDDVVAVAGLKDVSVVAEAAVEDIGARAADQDVVAGEAVQGVVAGEAEDEVVVAVPFSASLPGVPTMMLSVRRRGTAPLDVAQLVRAVERVLDRVRDDDLPVGGRGEGVLATVPWNLAMSMSPASCPSGSSRTIASWPGLIVPVNMRGRPASSCCCAFAIGVPVWLAIARREDADLHVEPLVAVDDVVAGAAHDGVAAVAAEDDVAGVEATVTPAPRTACRPAIRAMPAHRARCRGSLPTRPGRAGARSSAIVVGAGQNVVEARARQAFDRLRYSSSVAFGGRVGAFVEHDRDATVGVDRERVVLVGRPVEAGHAGHLAAAGAADHDVVAALADELVEAAVAEEDVVAVDAVAGEDLVEIVAGGAVEGAGLDPVVALVAEDAFGVLVAVDEVVAFAGEDLRAHVGAEEDEVLAGAAQDQVEARAGMDDVVAGAGLDVVVAAAVDDDVVAVAAVDDVVAEAALEPVVAAIAEERVVADAGDEGVVAAGLGVAWSVPPSTTWSPPV